ncbi:MAG: HlyD family secretion protein [Proteobacteria bacterium]|nr:MAG: HlyD family secretion protein [Pseudomonadota bacterium]
MRPEPENAKFMNNENKKAMKVKKTRFFKVLLLPLAVIIAVLVVRGMTQSKVPLKHEAKSFPERSAHVMTVKSIPFRARAVGYGNVEPLVKLDYRSEVGGKITYVHPNLKQGGSIAKGTVVVRIEPTSYEISLAQSKAGLANTRSSLARLDAEEKSAQNSLAIAQRNLLLEQQEYERIKSLWDKRLISRSVLDAEKQKVLQLTSTVQSIRGNLDTFSSRRAAINAQIEQSKSAVATKMDTLAKTAIKLPFDARIGKVSAEKGGYVGIGAQLFEALGTQTVEVEAQLTIGHAASLLSGGGDDRASQLQSPLSVRQAMKGTSLDATVRLVASNQVITWPATLVRIGETVDSIRDTISFVVRVEDPYRGSTPGKHLPLLKGLYVAVEFLAAPQSRIVIPRKAVHEGRVYLLNKENKLTIREVEVADTQGNLAVISDGLSEGERIVTSDLIPVIPGTPIKGVDVPEEIEQLRMEALGEGSRL